MVGALALLVTAPAGAAEPPAVAYYTDTGVEVATIGGDVISSFGSLDFMSLDGNVLAGSRLTKESEAIIALDATTGERLSRTRDAFAPIALADGRKIGFMPDRFAHRDPYFASVWLRTATGRTRAVVRFYGPNATVNPGGFEGEGIPLDQAWDAAGHTLAVTFGNDVDLFIYDVWVVDARTREATRVTRGQVSRYPSLSPSGDRLALVREMQLCGGEDAGHRASDLLAMDADGTNRTTLLEGTCALYYTDPRWISEDELAAARLTRTPSGDYDVDLVKVDAGTGSIDELVATGDVSFFSVSAELQEIAYERTGDSTGFSVYDLALGTSADFATGDIPHIAGAHRLI